MYLYFLVYGQDFTSFPAVPVLPGFQNETCFTFYVTDNDVYTPNYFIIISLTAFQIRFNSNFVVYLATTQTLNITVDDEKGIGSTCN